MQEKVQFTKHDICVVYEKLLYTHVILHLWSAIWYGQVI